MISIGLLILFSPLLIIVAIAIKLESRGPILFKQIHRLEHALLRAKYEGQLPSLRNVMVQLQEECGFRIDPVLFVEILQKSEE